MKSWHPFMDRATESPAASRVRPRQDDLTDSHVRERRFDARILIAALALSLLSGLLAVALLAYQRENDLEEGSRLTQAYAAVLDEQTTRTLQALDQRLELIGQELGLPERSDPAVSAMLGRQLARLPFVRALLVLDAQGQVRHATAPAAVGTRHENADDFQIYRTRPGSGFHLGQPQWDGASAQWVLRASRPIFDDAGLFSGVIVATIQSTYFESLWRTLALESHSVISLIRTDGTMLLRSPPDPATMRRGFAGSPLFNQHLPLAANGAFRMVSAIDGAPRLLAYRTLAQHPDLIVVVGRTVEAVLAPWRKLALLLAGGWCLASLALMGAAIYLGRLSAQRKAADRRSLAMAQRLSMASEAAGLVLWDWDLSATSWSVTPSYYTTLGLEPREGPVHLDAWLARVHPDDQGRWNQALGTIQPPSHDRCAFEARLRHADGSYRWVQETGQVLERDAAGKPAHVMGIRIDITAAKQAQIEREQVLARVSDAFVALDKDWRYTYVNAHAGALFGRDPKSLIGKHIWTEFPEDESQKLRSLYEKAMALQQAQHVEEYYPPYDRWFENHIYPSPDGLTIYFHDITERKTAETALRQAKEHAENLIEHANVMIVGLDAQGGVTLFNRAAQELTGYRLADLVGSSWFEVLCPRDRYPQVWQKFERTMGGGLVRQFENPILTREGKELTINWQNSVLRDADTVTGVLSFGIDVTARRQAEQDLAESRDQFETLAHNSIQGIALVRKGQLTYVNPALCAIGGRSAGEIMRLPMAQLMKWLHPDDRAASIERQRATLRGEPPPGLHELRVLHANGQWRWIQSASRSITLRGETAMLAIVIDIHERKLAEVALRASEERFRGIFESSAIGVSLANRDGQWLMINPALCHILGYPEHALMQRNYEQISHPDDMARDRMLTNELYEGKRSSFQMEKRYLHRDGHVVWVNLTVAMVRDADGQPVHTVAHIEDIGARKRLELELRSSQDNLRATLDALPDLMFEVDLQGRYLDYHSPRIDLLADTPKQFIGRHVDDIMPAEAAATIRAGLREAMARGHADGLQIALQLAEGQRWFELSIARKDTAPPEAPRFIVLSRDVSERIHTQNALRNSDELMRQMADSVSQMFWLMDMRENRYLYISPAVDAMLGCSVSDLAIDPKFWRRNIHPQDRERVDRQLAHARQTGHYDLQLRLLHPHGGERWLHARAYPIRDANQTLYRCAGMIEDITVRKTLEIREEQEREILQYLAGGHPMSEMLEKFVLCYEAMVPGMRGSVLLLDADGTRLHHGAAPHLPSDYSTAIDGEAIGPLTGSCGTAAYTGEAVIAADIANDPRWVHYKALALQHQLRACWSVPIKGMQGQVLGAFAFYFDQVRDATPSELATIERGAQLASQAIERHLAVRALQDSEERYRTLVEWSPEGIAVHQDGILVYANPAAAAIVGALSVREVLGRPMLDFVHPEEHAHMQRMIDGITRHGIPSALAERRYVRLDGTVIDVENKAGPSVFQGAPSVQVVFRDITARKKAEAELHDSRQQLRVLSSKVLAAQETERRRIAHELHDELGQALTAIKINLQAQGHLHHASGGAIQAENIRIVEGALQHVRGLALALRPSMLDDLGLAPALRWLTAQTVNQRSGLQVHLQAPSHLGRLAPELETAVFRIVQEALTNIVRHAQAQHVHIRIHFEDTDILCVRIQDDGIGFDVAAERRHAANGNSMGVLGMQERAALIGADLTMESVPGAGCTLTLRCPMKTIGPA